MRFITLIAFGIWVGLGFLIYQIKYETRDLEALTVKLARQVQEERENLAVARAEWNSPSRSTSKGWRATCQFTAGPPAGGTEIAAVRRAVESTMAAAKSDSPDAIALSTGPRRPGGRSHAVR
jgi:hypothetical protein